MNPNERRVDPQEIVVRVRFQETDAMGIVWHGNYFQYFEIGRTEWFRKIGLTSKDFQEQGLGFAVIRATVDYRRPARFDDRLTIRTRRVQPAEGPKMLLCFHHEILHEAELLAEGTIALACLNQEGRIRRLPDWLLNTTVSSTVSCLESREGTGLAPERRRSIRGFLL